MKTLSNSLAYPLLVFTFFIWGSVYVAAKLVSDALPPALLACLRCTTAMLPLLLMSRRYWGARIARSDWLPLFVVGGLGYFLTIQLVQVGILLTGASMAALINALTPVSVTLLAALLLKEPLTPVKCLCLLLALAGTVVITGGASSQGELLGTAVMLGSVVSWGFASVQMRRLTAKYPPVLVTTLGMAISLLFHLPVGLWSLLTQPTQFSAPVVGAVLYLGFIGSGVSQYTWTKCLSLLPASSCSLFYPLQAAFAALLGIWLLGERFTLSFLCGLLLISADVALNTWETRRLDRLQQAKSR